MTRDKCEHELKNTDCICVKCGACMIDGCDGDETNCSHMADVKECETRDKELLEINKVILQCRRHIFLKHGVEANDNDLATALKSYMDRKEKKERDLGYAEGWMASSDGKPLILKRKEQEKGDGT